MTVAELRKELLGLDPNLQVDLSASFEGMWGRGPLALVTMHDGAVMLVDEELKPLFLPSRLGELR